MMKYDWKKCLEGGRKVTVKKRLFISNILMILVPVGITTLIGLVCVGLIWLTVANGSGLGFEDSEDFYRASEGISAMVEHAMNAVGDEREERLQTLFSLIDQNSMALRIQSDGTELYHYGQFTAGDETLVTAVEALGGSGSISRDGRSLYAGLVTASGKDYVLQLFSSQLPPSYGTLKAVIAFTVILLAFTIFLSILVTNRFLTRFMFRKIEQPLEVLAKGVIQIRDGNLDMRIDYSEKDEFAPICAAFNEMAVRLKTSVEITRQHEKSRRELLVGISHDLRSPLTSIQAYVEGLLDGVAKTPEMRQSYLTTIKTKSEDISHMVSQLFLFSKMEMDDYPVSPKVLRLDQEIERFVEEYTAKELELSTELIPAKVSADVTELRRIFTNITDNSRKYRVVETAHLKISLQSQDNHLLLSFTDDGPGVPEEACTKLMDVFYRTDPARQNPDRGSGLGLAITAKAVARMGGEISAYNIPTGGLCIAITLPEGGAS